MATPGFGATPAFGATPGGGATPAFAAGAAAMATPMSQMTPELARERKVRREMDARNRPLSDADLDAALPGEADGYAVVPPPATYHPIRTPARKLMGAPDASMTPGMTPAYMMPAENPLGTEGYGITKALPDGLPDIREEDMEYFAPLLKVRACRPCDRSRVHDALRAGHLVPSQFEIWSLPAHELPAANAEHGAGRLMCRAACRRRRPRA